MTSHLARGAFVVASMAGGGTVAVAAIPIDHAATIAVLVAAVGVVAGGIAWIDGRIDRRMKAHEAAEFAKDDAAARLDSQRHDHVMAEIAHVKELIGLRSGIRALAARDGG